MYIRDFVEDIAQREAAELIQDIESGKIEYADVMAELTGGGPPCE